MDQTTFSVNKDRISGLSHAFRCLPDHVTPLATKQQQQAISTTKLFVQIQYVLLEKQKVQFTTVAKVSKAVKLSPETNSYGGNTTI